jgi:hypothetical protein
MVLSEIDYSINLQACRVNVLRVWPELRRLPFNATEVFLDFLKPVKTVLHLKLNHVSFTAHKEGV